MSWDYHTYLRQPEWFLADIVEAMAADNKAAELDAKRAKQGTDLHG